MAEASNLAAVNGGAVRVRAVFNHQEMVTLGDLHQARHVRGLSKEMNGQDRRCLRRDGVRNGLRIDAARGCVDIHKMRSGAALQDRLSRGTKRQGGA